MIKYVDRFTTKNPAYKNNVNKADSRYTEFQKNGAKGAVLHSIGTPQPKAEPIADYFDSATVEASVHMVLQADGLCLRLAPDNYRMWHVGGSANNTHLGIEMTEPDCISYDPKNGYKLTVKDYDKARDHVVKTYARAVELFAELCTKYGWNPLEDGVILSHKECYKRGIGSNHGDPEHLWDGLKTGYTMDGFRKDVMNAMHGISSDSTPSASGTESVRYRVQCGAYRERANAEELLEKLKKAGFDAFIVEATETETTDPGYSLKQFIMDVQTAIGAAVDGVAGAETLSKTVTLSASINARHKAVKPVQRRLLALGYTEVGEADGVAGAKFTSAVKRYQRENGCTADGEISAKDKTWKKLLGIA